MSVQEKITTFLVQQKLLMVMYSAASYRFQSVISYSWFMASDRDWRKLILLMMLLISAV
jgi:hypothetical protein